MHRFCLVTLLLAACAVDAAVDDDLPGDENIDVCTEGPFRCLAQARASAADSYTMFASAAPKGYGPAELQQAYSIPAASNAPTVAIVVAYGYKKLAADLAEYRDYFGLPPCTTASGCLTIVNQHGAPSPLPAEPSLKNDWTLETMLDVAMVSAACPACRLVVIQCNDSGSALLDGQDTAVEMGVDVISDSWGGPEVPGFSYDGVETHFDHPAIATFVATGDSGFNSDGHGPSYPGTSAHVIGVGGTRLTSDADAPRGFTETAWSHGGSACSLTIAKPAYQKSMSPCGFRASSDIAAVGDPATGVAVYHSRTNPPWKVVGGTSASAPLMAGLFAAIDHGRETAANLAAHADAFHDVTSGKNGNCSSLLCAAAKGWDGPTGIGTPNAAKLAGVTLPDPPVDTADPGPAAPGMPFTCSAARPTDGAWLIVLLVPLRRRRLRAKHLAR